MNRRRLWIAIAAITTTMAVASVGTLGYLLFIADTDAVEGDVMACLPTRDFRSSAEDDPDRVVCPPADAEFVQGLIVADDGTFITVQPGAGPAQKVLVRDPDRRYIDIAHGQTHAALGQPVRVYVDEFEGETIAIYMEDAPLSGQDSNLPHANT